MAPLGYFAVCPARVRSAPTLLSWRFLGRRMVAYYLNLAMDPFKIPLMSDASPLGTQGRGHGQVPRPKRLGVRETPQDQYLEQTRPYQLP